MQLYIVLICMLTFIKKNHIRYISYIYGTNFLSQHYALEILFFFFF